MNERARPVEACSSPWRTPDPARLWESLATSIDCFVTVIDPDLRVRAVNQVAEGFEPAGIIGRSILEFIHPDDVDRVSAEYARMFVDRSSVAIDMLVVDERGRVASYSVRGAPVVEEGRVVAAVLTAHDQHALAASEASLREERGALRALLDTLERERRMISYEIHDGLAQSLASAAMHLDASIHALGAAGPPALARDLREARRGVTAAIEEARRMINGLRPPMLDELGIAAAVESLVLDARAAGLRVDYRAVEPLPAMASEVAISVFRIVQESLSNVRKHAAATTARVAVEPAGPGDAEVRVEVSDDGVGFDPAAVAGKGFGLEGIRQRARLLGREVTITTRRGGGTRVEVVLPAAGWRD